MLFFQSFHFFLVLSIWILWTMSVLILVLLCGGFGTVSSMCWICSWIAWQKQTKSSLNLVWVVFAIAHQVCAGKVQPHWTPFMSMCAPLASSCLTYGAKRWFNRRHWIYSRYQMCFHSPKFLLPRCHVFLYVCTLKNHNKLFIILERMKIYHL